MNEIKKIKDAKAVIKTAIYACKKVKEPELANKYRTTLQALNIFQLYFELNGDLRRHYEHRKENLRTIPTNLTGGAFSQSELKKIEDRFKKLMKKLPTIK